VTTPQDPDAPPTRRDAKRTRRLLLSAALRRFASAGYGDVTVRDIAGDAGVNVALINRYFTSKEGLFEACLANAVDELDETVSDEMGLERVVALMIEQIEGSPDGGAQLRLMLLLRSSGDARADQIRRDVFQSFAERLAAAVGRDPRHGESSDSRLRAEIALSAILGIVVARASIGPEPLASATGDDLVRPIADVLSALLKSIESE
jgi:AcrR family transcriptional regulator